MKLFRKIMLCLLMLPLSAFAGGFDRKAFNLWIDARAGSGEPVYWYSTGTVRAYPSGELLFYMEGYDTARAHWPDPAEPVAHQYNRKIYIFRDAKTGEILREWNGEAVEPVAYPYQFISYALDGDGMRTSVEQGSGAQVRTVEGSGMDHRMVGDTHVFSAPVFLDFPIPGGERRYQAWENYDFFIQPEGSVSEPHQLSWARVGPLPAWAGGAQSVMHLVTWRVEHFDEVPEDFRAYIENEAALWQMPPRDLDEIRELQQGD
jgi:hypothetical protein